MGRVGVTFYGALAKVTGEKNVEISGSVLREVMNTLSAKYGEQFQDKIHDQKGKLRRFINIYVNGRDIRFLDHLNTQLNEGDKVSIVPAVGGG
ncbi:MAG: ubiquitin-like small modifier protein 1 [Candidatus Bathyarchaeia archaeon]